MIIKTFTVAALLLVGLASCSAQTPLEKAIDEASALFKKDKFEQAAASYTKILAMGENFDSIEQKAGIYINRGAALHRLNRNGLAIEDYNRALELSTGLAEAYANRGIAFDTLGEHVKAMADYRKALELKPDLGEPPGIIRRVLWNIQEVPATIKDRLVFLEKMIDKKDGPPEKHQRK